MAAEVDERLRYLEQTLEDKEQLVTALTVQLEEACERLDRFHRMGSDRGATVGGIPREFVEEQRSVLDELQEAVQRLEEMHAGAGMSRIEMQIGELRDLVVERTSMAAVAAATAAVQRSAELRSSSQSRDSTSSSVEDEETPSRSSRHERDVDVSGVDLEGAHDWVAPPPAVDFSRLSEDARAAVESRDEYIVWLIRRLRVSEAEKYSYATSQNEDETPDEFQQRLAELQLEFDQKQRMAEIELSIERARLAREEAQLRMNQEKLQTDIRRAGQNQPPAATPIDAKDPESAKNRRWRRMLGMGGDEK